MGVYYLLFAKMRSRDCSREFNALNTMVVARRMADALVENRWKQIPVSDLKFFFIRFLSISFVHIHPLLQLSSYLINVKL